MANHQLLNNVDHKALRVRRERSAAFGDNVHYALTYPFEFRAIQAHYPIFFHKDATSGQFHALAMLGFEKGENLFLTDAGWDGDYIPLSLCRAPFLIGFDGGDRTPVIHVDMDDPRISEQEGEPVFLDHGGRTEFLEEAMETLTRLHEGHQSEPAFMAMLQELDLLEPFALDITLDDGSDHRLAGFYVIHEENLYALDGEALGRLNAAGYLQPVFMAVASLSRIRTLIARKNALLRLAG